MDINTIVAEYMKAKEAESAAKKLSASLKNMILDYANGQDNFTTNDYTVVIKTSTSARLDTASLYKDFPDIKSVYEKTTTSTTITAVCTASAGQKIA